MSQKKIINRIFLIEKYINDKLSSLDIAKLVGCSSTTVYKYLEKYKIKRRTISSALKGKLIGTNNPNYKHGNKIRKYFHCKECGKQVTHGCFSGLCKLCAHKGERAYNYIDGYSSKYKEHKCKDCGKRISINSKKGRCNECNLKTLFGENNPNWIDGRSFKPYTSEFNSELKTKIRKRDKYTCQNCGMTEEEHLIVIGTNLHIHHIDYDKINCKETNLITLCNQCNTRANKNRDYWINYYTENIKCKYC